MKAAANVLRDFAINGHQLLLFTCHEHIVEAFRQIKVEVRTLPNRHEVPEVIEAELEPVPEPVFVALPVVEKPQPLPQEDFTLADEEPLPELPPFVPPRRELALWDEDELRLSDEELPTPAEYLDDITIEMDVEPEPVRMKQSVAAPEFDFTLAEAPRIRRPAPLMPPPRPEPVMVMHQEPSGFEELHYDEPGPEQRTSRFTWESPERWWREKNEDAA